MKIEFPYEEADQLHTMLMARADVLIAGERRVRAVVHQLVVFLDTAGRNAQMRTLLESRGSR
jgi:hypothetical protein